MIKNEGPDYDQGTVYINKSVVTLVDSYDGLQGESCLRFTVPNDAPNTLTYICTQHPTRTNSINLLNEPPITPINDPEKVYYPGACVSLGCSRINLRTVANSSRTGVREFPANNTVVRAIR